MVGDIVLKRFSDVATKQVKSIDYVARFGGEEFVLILLKSDQKQGLQIAEVLTGAEVQPLQLQARLNH